MLPDLRFAIGGAVAVSLLGMTGLGLVAAVRLAHHAKMGPLEASRSLAFANQSEWNPFYDPESVRLFVDMARKPGPAEPPAQTVPPEAVAPVLPVPYPPRDGASVAPLPPPPQASVALPAAPQPPADAAAGDDAGGRKAAPIIEASEPVAASAPAPPDPPTSAQAGPRATEKPAEVAAVEPKAAAAPRIVVPEEPSAKPPGEPEAPAAVATSPPIDQSGVAASEPTATAAGASVRAAVASVPVLAEAGEREAIVTVATAAKVPPVSSTAPAGNGVKAPLPEPVYANIEELVAPVVKPVATAPPPPKVQAKPKERAGIRREAQPRVPPAARQRLPQQRIGEYGPYYYGTNPWAQ